MRYLEEMSEGGVAESGDVAQTTPDNSHVESEARQFGWVPVEEFRGNKESWVDADAFVKRGKEINPILRKNNERLMTELNSTKSQIAELRAATEEFKKFQQETFAKKEVELRTELETLKIQKKQAIREGDGDLAVDLDDQIDTVRENITESQKAKVEAARVPEPVQQPVPPEVGEWMDSNSWYSKDSKMRAATDAVASQIVKDQPWLAGKAFLDALDRELSNTFSEEKLGKRVKPRSPVEGSTTPSKSSGKQSFDNLPSEAKVAADKFVKQGIIKSREEYVKMYDWS
jgi:hypothetical protein